jgi:opacity protein-like surface antigen
MACIALAAPTFGADETYLSLAVGRTLVNDATVKVSDIQTRIKTDFDKGGALAAAIGVRTQKIYRGEIELSTQKSDIDTVMISGVDNVNVKGDVSVTAFLANGYYDFVSESAFTPYISVGLGMAEVAINDTTVRYANPASTEAVPLPDIVYSFKDDDIIFAYQLGAGVGCALGSHFNIDLRYRYFGTNEAKFDNGKMDYVSHNFYLGVRYGF